MADSRRRSAKDAPPNVHMTKKCPDCFTYLPLNAKVCHSCGKGVGPVNKLGLAERPLNVKGYFMAGVAILAFIIFMWWGFFTD